MIGLLWLSRRRDVAVADAQAWTGPASDPVRRLTEAEKAGTVVLWHPESPGVEVRVRPCLARRLGLVRGEFATYGEMHRGLVSYAGGLPWIAGGDLEHVTEDPS